MLIIALIKLVIKFYKNLFMTCIYKNIYIYFTQLGCWLILPIILLKMQLICDFHELWDSSLSELKFILIPIFSFQRKRAKVLHFHR